MTSVCSNDNGAESGDQAVDSTAPLVPVAKESRVGIARLRAALEAVRFIEITGAQIAWFAGSKDLLIDVKPDGSKVTDKDRLVARRLHELLPQCIDAPVITEETLLPYEQRKDFKSYWLCDPIDGTSSYIEGRGDYTILASYIEDSRPVIGIIHSPVEHRTLFAVSGEGVFLKDENGELTQVFAESLQSSEIIHAGTKDLKGERLAKLKEFTRQNNIDFSLVKETTSPSGYAALEILDGKAGSLVACGLMHEWDLVSTDCIFSELGLTFLDGQGQIIQYNREPSITMDVKGMYAGWPGKHSFLNTFAAS